MAKELVASGARFKYPLLAQPRWNDFSSWEAIPEQPNGLAMYEDNSTICVEASLPGVDPKTVDITIDNGILHISGEAAEETKGRRYYHKAKESFIYDVLIPRDVIDKNTPKAESKNGIIKVTFIKSQKTTPKKIVIITS